MSSLVYVRDEHIFFNPQYGWPTNFFLFSFLIFTLLFRSCFNFFFILSNGMMMRKEEELKRVWVPGPLIIGAGPSGLAVAACLKKRGVPSLVLEKHHCLASLWKLKTYDRLRLHLPNIFCELPYMKFPSDFPTYPTKQQFISYLEDYAKRFSIELMFGQEARWAKYERSMGLWEVETKDSRFLCRWVIVATGENAEPVIPEISGMSNFGGRMLHTSAYKNGADFKGSKVLVVGCGNSGMEVSLDLCNSGAQVSLVVRDKLHILPREIFGISTFALSMWLLRWLPVRLVDKSLLLCSRMVLGDTARIGIRRPESGPFHLKNTTGKTPVLDVGAVAKIRSRQVKVVCGIRRFTTKGVEFVNGEVQDFDSVILATGYRTNVASWLKDGNFFSQKDGYPKNPFPNNWKGDDGVYSVGFTRRGLYGASIDAQRVAEDIARQWKSQTKHLHL